MKRTILSLLLGLYSCTFILAQEANDEPVTLDDQFEEVIERSNSYQEFKVIKKASINQLRQNVNDSLIAIDQRIRAISGTVEAQETEINDLKAELEATRLELVESKKKENGIYLFGILLNKTTYNVLLWSIIAGLLVLLGFFILKFKNSNRVTREANKRLSEIEIEYEDHRSRALEREQQLRRKLQDELNKKKKTN